MQEVNELKQGVADYFRNLFAKEDWKRPILEGMEFNKIFEAEKELLTKPFLESEVKAAVWNCDSAKAPGPDGLSFGFLKAKWEVVKDDILKFLTDFHINNKLVRGSNSSFPVLIPKKENPQGLEEYRPISLIGCMYKILAKILTKILANRLSKVLDGLIGEQQSTFIGGRQLVDGVVIANETIDEIRRKKLSCFLFRADFEKAYDNVSWEFLDYMLERMNFGLVWRGWIRECLQTNSVSVVLYGSPTKEFTMCRGLRQGDPLAPFLFLIVAEGLNGDGRNTKFWLDEWVGGSALSNKFPRLFMLSTSENYNVKDMGTWMNGSWQWKLLWKRQLRSWEEDMETELLEMLKTAHPIQNKEDQWWWQPEPSGNYTSKSAYSHLLKGDTRPIADFTRMWKASIPPKCNTSTETPDHLLVNCNLASSLWMNCYKWWGKQYVLGLDGFSLTNWCENPIKCLKIKVKEKDRV
ncbi:hypothetical protein SLEP1_g2599 [Rubroshorea leprosula]|uniref:Reverse transcriptase domain-containing protein n=1 Tax=Rubroshorea leprosula TaxID=152421 RepID=A0AAV5HM25_9ROSI|nr:hypothetical protein SLEP1_g2599 [Rubroshorea leprosula]